MSLIKEGLIRLEQFLLGIGIFDFPILLQIKLFMLKPIIKIGKGCIISYHTLFYVPHELKREKVIFGEKVKIARGVEIDCCRKIIIGNGAWVSQYVQIFSHIHNILENKKNDDGQIRISDKLNIEEDAWIGANAIIMPKVTYIGKGAIIGAGAVVTKNVDNYTIVAGNPAKAIGFREKK